MLVNNDLVLIALVALGLGFTFIGLKSNMGIFNLLTVPIWALLGIEFIQTYPILAITFIGLVIFEFYIALWREN